MELYMLIIYKGNIDEILTFYPIYNNGNKIKKTTMM